MRQSRKVLGARCSYFKQCKCVRVSSLRTAHVCTSVWVHGNVCNAGIILNRAQCVIYEYHSRPHPPKKSQQKQRQQLEEEEEHEHENRKSTEKTCMSNSTITRTPRIRPYSTTSATSACMYRSCADHAPDHSSGDDLIWSGKD